jgi:hypothetical protein
MRGKVVSVAGLVVALALAAMTRTSAWPQTRAASPAPAVAVARDYPV